VAVPCTNRTLFHHILTALPRSKRCSTELPLKLVNPT